MRSVGPVTAVRDGLNSSAALLSLPFGLSRSVCLDKSDPRAMCVVVVGTSLKPRRHLIDIIRVEQPGADQLLE